jgi:hypothetical protein
LVGVGAAFLVGWGLRLDAQRRRRLGNVDRRDRVERGDGDELEERGGAERGGKELEGKRDRCLE